MSPLKVGINLLPFRHKLGGVGRYAKNLTSEILLQDRVNRYFLFVTKENEHHFPVEAGNGSHVRCPISSSNVLSRVLYEQIVLPRKLREFGIDLLFTPSVAIPLAYGGIKLTTVHDIAYDRVRNKYGLLRRWYVAFITRQAVLRSNTVITVSDFSRSEIAAKFHLDAGNILLTPNGVGKEFFTKAAPGVIKETRKRYGLPDNYILNVGAIEPSKNIPQLLDAFVFVAKKKPELVLVLTGGIGWRSSLETMIATRGLHSNIVVLGHVSEEDLVHIYQGARLFVQTSGYEGFGLPVLEAMAAGTPVLSKHTHAIEEFAGDSIAYVESLEPEDMSRKILTVLGNKRLLLSLARSGRNRAREFDWRSSAKVLLAEINRWGHS